MAVNQGTWLSHRKGWNLADSQIGVRLTHKCQAECNITRYYLIIGEGLMSSEEPQVKYIAFFSPREDP